MGLPKKPSAACGPCRSRRAKCDKRRPGCLQCARKFITCSGYRDLSDLPIRDETRAVAHKVLRRNQGSDTSSSHPATTSLPSEHKSKLAKIGPCANLSADENNRIPSDKPSRPTSTPPPPRPLIESFDEIATVLFINSYLPGTKFAELLSTCDESLLCCSSVSSALQAAAFAYLLVNRPDQAVQRAAKEKYCHAISETNIALADPWLAGLDSTLISVLLLGLFESFNFSDSYSVSSWAAHARGAVALLCLRGPDQFTTYRGRTLFATVTHHVRISCIQRGQPVPDELQSLLSQFASTATAQESKLHRVSQLIDNLVTIRVSLNKPMIHSEDLTYVIRTMRDMDKGIVTQGPQLLCSKFVDRHVSATGVTDIPSVRKWLASRLIRLFLNNTLRRLTLPAVIESKGLNSMFNNEALAIQEMSQGAVRSIAAEILVAIPSFLDSAQEGSLTIAPYLLWPLRLLASLEFCPSSEQAEMMRQLRELGNQWSSSPMGQAASMVRESTIREDWVLLSHLS
ncbi:hypothetical protein GQ53DRAFT_839566 [Thozetella sp. PMI_491]|nr:hypothetical protein GQ53DRAFT_839566 [Thozetella sp. PMI_491]